MLCFGYVIEQLAFYQRVFYFTKQLSNIQCTMDCGDWSKDISRFRAFSFISAEKFFISKSWTSRQGSRGYKFFAESYIHDVFAHKTDFIIRAKCYRSQKKSESPHRLFLQFSPSMDAVVKGHCTCEAGNSESCNHVVGLAYFLQHIIFKGFDEIPENMSCTSLPMEWNKPRGAKIVPEQLPGSVYYNPTKVNRTKDPVICKIRNPIRNKALTEISTENVITLKETLSEINVSIGFASTLSTENMADTRTILLGDGIHVPAASILGHMARAKRADRNEQQLYKELPITLPVDDKEMVDILIGLPPVYNSCLRVLSMEEVAIIEKKTRKQNLSDEWKEMRRFRFTASKFGFVCKRKLYNAAFFKEFIQPDDISHVRAVAHGTKTEPVAIVKYLEKNACMSFFKCGFVIHPYAIHLGASPDGVLYDRSTSTYGILEIKCPCSSKVQSLKEYAILKTFCMKADENGILRLKHNHDYYYQVQGQMLLSGLRWAEFVVYIAKTQEIAQERINFDPLFCDEMYKKLSDVYHRHMEETFLIHCS